MIKKEIGLLFALVFSVVSIGVQAEDVTTTNTAVVPATNAVSGLENTKRPVPALRQDLLEAQKNARAKALEQREGVLQTAKETRSGIKEDTKATIKDIRTNNPGQPGEVRTQVKELRDQALEQMKENRTNAKEELQTIRATKVEALKENREKFQTDLEVRKKEIQAQVAEQKKVTQEKRVKLQEEAKAKVQDRLKTIFTRFENTLQEIAKTDAKIVTRINTLTQNGGDTGAVSVQLKTAQGALEKAKSDVAAAKAVATSETNTTTNQETLKSLVKTAEDSIKLAGGEYRKTINLLRMVTPVTTSAGTTEGSSSATQ